MTHILFLPGDETLPSAPFSVAGQSDTSDAVSAMEVEGESSGSATRRNKPTLADWRRIRSVFPDLLRKRQPFEWFVLLITLAYKILVS